MPREYKEKLEDILEAIRRVREYSQSLSEPEFLKDLKTQDAVIRNLQIIGEAAKGLPEEIRSKHSEIDWRRIVGLRDIITHRYFGIDFEIIWDVVKGKLDALERDIRKILNG
jgi:uncharacterized protein with HEPN domain